MFIILVKGNTTLQIYLFIIIFVMLAGWLTLDTVSPWLAKHQNFRVSELDN